MSYELALTPEAREDIHQLVSSLPPRVREDALHAIETELEKLALNPGLAVRSTLGRPTLRFRFIVGGATYHWAATFGYSQDERTIVITHVFRTAL